MNAGLGLGLSICKRICNSLGGDIRLKSSKLKQGSVFEFSIACQKDNYIDDSDAVSFSVNSSQMSNAFILKREKLKVKVGKTFQEDENSFR